MPPVIRTCPAKINLSLRVLGRRTDGFHELDSVFLPLELCDRLTLTVVPQRQTTVACACPGHEELSGEDNLAARAASAYLAAAGASARITIHLRKKIWIAAGLGGGSSDAAAVLIGLSQMVGGVSDDDLCALALKLGADVPFFLDPRPARARGVGHRLTPLSEVAPLDLVLVNPGRPLSTAAVFAELGLERGARNAERGARNAERGAEEREHHMEDLVALVGNDLQPAALRLEPEIARMEQALLEHGARVACMTGSGPTVFGVFQGAEAAETAAMGIADATGYQTMATRSRSQF